MASKDPHQLSKPFSEILGYEAAFYSLPDPVFIYNHSERRIINANDAAMKRYGFTSEQFREMGPWDVEEPFDKDTLVARIDRLKESGSVVYQTQHRTAEGECFPAEVNTIYRNFNGVDIFVAICRETTDRLKSEQLLKKAETHYQAIFENVGSLICVADLNTEMFLEVNPAFEKLLGYTRAELLQRPFTELVHPDDLNPTKEVVRELMEDSAYRESFQNRYRCKDGRYVWLDWSSQPFFEQGVSYAVAKDITEQKWFEERLRQQNQRMRLHVEQTPLGVIEWSLDFRVTAWNSAAERIFGYSQEEALGQKGLFILPSGAEHSVSHVWEQLVSNKGGARSTNTNLHKSGAELLCEWHNTTLVDEEGQIIGIASLVMDVTEQEHRKLELEQAKEAAEKANRAKSEFLSMMSHELRTPLNSIVGPCELVRQQIKDPALKPLIEVMLTSSAHLLDLINSILDLSKIESGNLEVVRERYSTTDFFSQRLLPLKVSAEKKGLGFDIHNRIPDGAQIETDGRILLQILFNVVGNAIKFTPKGAVSIRVEAKDGKACIDVVDTGVGIDSGLQDNLFEPFRKAPDTLSKAQSGSGLGLSITKRLLEMLDGQISFTSSPGKGSSFKIVVPSVSFPTQTVTRESPSAERQGKAKGPRSEKILLVEDEPNNQLVNAALLKFLKYPCDIASSGEEAVEMWKARRHPIVLMDVKLPGIDGVEACRRIKSLAGKDPVVVIAQSAHALSAERDAFLRNGMDDYISKPISLESLREALEGAVKRCARDD